MPTSYDKIGPMRESAEIEKWGKAAYKSRKTENIENDGLLSCKRILAAVNNEGW